jgi:hypothetical protein
MFDIIGKNIHTAYQMKDFQGKNALNPFLIHFSFSLPSGALKRVLPNSTNRICKNELGPKI